MSVRVENLSFSYPNSEKLVLKDVNLKIQEGEMVLVTGPNASGKTTLCKCFNGLVPHATGGKLTGKVEVCGIDVMKNSIFELARYVGYIFQSAEDQLVTPKVKKELSFGLENLALPREILAERVEETIRSFKMEDLKDKLTFHLSTGQKQLVAIASSVIMKPKILVLDDPLSHLNKNLAKKIVKYMVKLNREEGVTIVWIAQDMEDLFKYVDRIVIVEDGSIRFDGSPTSFLHFIEDWNSTVFLPQFIELSRSLVQEGFPLSNIPKSMDEAIDRYRSVLCRPTSRPIRSLRRKKFKPHTEKIVQIENLFFQYPNGFLALRGINLEITKGEFVLLTGENGSGKTTLMKHLNGLLRPSKGRVIIEGEDIFGTPTSKLAKKVGFLFQNPDHQLSKSKVREEMAFSLVNFGYDERKIEKRVEEFSHKLNLEPLLDRPPQELSGSEKKKVTVASILIYDPKILILDEPTANLDRAQTQNMIETLESFHNKERVTIVVSHDIKQWCECGSINRVVVLKDGTVFRDGTPEQILTDEMVMNYLNLDLFPVTKIARRLSDFGVETDIYNVKGLQKQLLWLMGD